MVAHRLSTIRDADRICLLHQGRLVEQGTHEELLELDGRYAALWLSQTDEGRSQLEKQRERQPFWTAVGSDADRRDRPVRSVGHV